jgi:hypothetical protein
MGRPIGVNREKPFNSALLWSSGAIPLRGAVAAKLIERGPWMPIWPLTTIRERKLSECQNATIRNTNVDTTRSY